MCRHYLLGEFFGPGTKNEDFFVTRYEENAICAVITIIGSLFFGKWASAFESRALLFFGKIEVDFWIHSQFENKLI